MGDHRQLIRNVALTPAIRSHSGVPPTLSDVYSIDMGKSGVCNLPSYRTHGLGHHVQNRPNNQRRGRGRGGMNTMVVKMC